MFSRLSPALKTGTSSIKIFSPVTNCLRVASASTNAVNKLALPENFPLKKEGPERDLINFPRPKMPEYGGKVRMGFVPEEFFQFFYKKTGVTGPYVFGSAVITFLLSKEIFVIEHEFWNGVSLFILLYIGVKKFGPGVAAYLDKQGEEELKELTEPQKLAVANYQQFIEDEKKSQWQAEGQMTLIEAKRENVALQLEAEYRKRLVTAYEEVKKRLDYQLMIANAKRQTEHNHMVNWISEQVMKSITPQQESEALKQCISDLKTLAAKA